MSHAQNDAAGVADRPTVALALGAGGAKGLAHIGVIEEIEAQGFEIVAIAGTSMGALIGGVHAMGKLDVYRDWVTALARFDVLRLVDWTFSGGGLIKGERIIGTLRELIGDTRIEELPLAFTAVATDLDRGREVWLSCGSLFDAIRASIAVPHHMPVARDLTPGVSRRKPTRSIALGGGSRQPQDRPVSGEVDPGRRGHLGQPRHRHHVAADQHHEAGPGREPDLTHVQRVPHPHCGIRKTHRGAVTGQHPSNRPRFH